MRILQDGLQLSLYFLDGIHLIVQGIAGTRIWTVPGSARTQLPPPAVLASLIPYLEEIDCRQVIGDDGRPKDLHVFAVLDVLLKQLEPAVVAWKQVYQGTAAFVDPRGPFLDLAQ